MPEQRKGRPAPRMIRIEGIEEDHLSEVKMAVPGYVNVSWKGGDAYAMTSSSNIKARLEERFGADKVEIVDSDQEVYKKAFSIQSALNWRKFVEHNEDYAKDKDNMVYVYIRSSPFETSKEDLSVSFAQRVVEEYDDDGTNRLKFIIRGWEREWFKKIREEKLLKDRNGKVVEAFSYFVSRMEIVRPGDKIIICRMYIEIKLVESLIDELSRHEIPSVCSFKNPGRIEEMSKRRNEKREREHERRKKVQRRGEKGDGDADRQAEEEDGKKDAKPFIRDRRNKRGPIRRNNQQGGRAASEEINISVDDDKKRPPREQASVHIRIFLSEFPHNTVDKMIAALRNKITGCRFEKHEKDLTLIVSKSREDDARATLGNVKVNGKAIRYE